MSSEWPVIWRGMRIVWSHGGIAYSYLIRPTRQLQRQGVGKLVASVNRRGRVG